MNPVKVRRDRMVQLTDLPNVGPSIAENLELLGFSKPAQFAGQDPLHLYQMLCRKTGVRQDPCVLDVFMAITRFMDGERPRPWWAYTKERKRRYGAI